MRSELLCRPAFYLLLTVLLAPLALQAQESADSEEGEIEEVYVTATKRDERLIDVPMAVTALQGEMLIERNLLQIEDFAEQVPGLIVENFSNRATRVVLRGLNSGGAGANVSTMIDEAYLSYSSSTSNGAIDIANPDTYDMNRIEVLRGPQGTLYGAAAVGGIVKYVTNAPNLDTFQGDVEVGLQSIQHGDTGFTGRGMLNIPLAEGKAALRFTGFYLDVPGYIDNNLYGEKNANDGERYGGRIQLLVEPNENWSIRLMAMFQDQSFNDNGLVELVGATLTPNQRNPGEFKLAHGGDLQWNTPYPSIHDNELRLYYANIEYSGRSFNFLSATSYGQINSTFRSDITHSEAIPGTGIPLGLAFGGAFGVPFINIWGDQTNDLTKFNQEFRIASKETLDAGSIGWDWQFGVFYSDEEIVFNQFYDSLDPITGEVLLTDVFAPLGYPQLPTGGSELPANYEELSGFGEINLVFSDQWELALGGRYSTNEQWSQVTNRAGLITAPVDIVNPVVESDESKFTWSIAPSYHYSDSQVLYARVATGYRPGGPALIIPGAPPDFPLSYDSDSSINYEIGTKGSTASGKFSYDVAAFYIDWTDIQVLTQFVSESSGITYTITGNAGEAVSKGFEWNLTWEIVDGLILSDNGAYVNAKLTTDAPGLGGYDGDYLPAVPDWTNTLNLDYSWTAGNSLLAVGGSWRYTGERSNGFGAPPSPELDRYPGSYVLMPSYNTFSVYGTISWDSFRIRAFIRNLTDEEGLFTYAVSGGFNATGLGQMIQPRTYGITFGYSW